MKTKTAKISMQRFGLHALVLGLFIFAFTACSNDDTESPDPNAPRIEAAAPADIEAVGGQFDIPYVIHNPVEGAKLEAESGAEWLTVSGVSSSVVRCRAGVWAGDEARSATLTLRYAGAEELVLTLTQLSPTVARNLTFEMELVEVKSRSVTLNCIPSKPSATWIGTIISKEDWERDYHNDEGFLDHYINTYIPWAEEELGWGVESLLRTGSLEQYEIAALIPEKEYYFAAFGLNADLTLTSPEIFKLAFTTTSPEMQECSFSFSVRPGLEYTYISVSPSTWEVQYLWGVMLKSEFEALGENPGKQIMEQIRAKVDAEVEAGGEAWFGDYVVAADQSNSFSDLVAGERYVAYAFGCDVSGRGEPTTELFTCEFVEERLAEVECSFAFSFQHIRAGSFAALITPSDETVRWTAYTMPYEDFTAAYDSVEQMAEIFVDALATIAPDWMVEGSDYLYSGEQWLTNFDMFNSMLIPETPYIVIAFGVDASGNRNTRVMSTTVTTTAVGNPSSMVIDIAYKQRDNGAVVLTFTGSQREVFFYDLVPAAYRDEFSSDTHFMEYMVNDYKSKGMLEYKLQIGEATMEVEQGLMPGTEYLAYAFGYDHRPSTGLYTERFTTASYPMGGLATIHDIVVRIEDGDYYYAQDPYTYEACRGKALLTCYSTTSSDAAGYYQANFSMLDPTLTDQQLVDLVVSMGDPYEMSYIVDWESTTTMLAVAIDAEGRAGAIFRKEVTAHRADVASPTARKINLKGAK